jgi:hypothetical protein
VLGVGERVSTSRKVNSTNFACRAFSEVGSVLLLENPFPKDVHYLQEVVGTSISPILGASYIPNLREEEMPEG